MSMEGKRSTDVGIEYQSVHRCGCILSTVVERDSDIAKTRSANCGVQKSGTMESIQFEYTAAVDVSSLYLPCLRFQAARKR